MEMKQKEIEFKSLPRCNIYGLHVVHQKDNSPSILVITLNGQLYQFSLDDQGRFSSVNSFRLQNDASNTEIISSDIFRLPDEWLLLAAALISCDHFGNVKSFWIQTFKCKDKEIIHLSTLMMSSSCSLLTFIPTSVLHNLTLLTFNSNKSLSCYLCDIDICSLVESRIENVLPELNMMPFPGLVLRIETVVADDKRWTVIGCDTGHVMLSLVNTLDNTVLNRCELKFDTPISALCCLYWSRDRISLLIGPSLSPSTVWQCMRELNDNLKWSKECEFENSGDHDCVLSANCWRNRENDKLTVSICTFGQKLLLYNMNQSNGILSTDWLMTIDFPSPVICAQILTADNDNVIIAILSWNGLHIRRINRK